MIREVWSLSLSVDVLLGNPSVGSVPSPPPPSPEVGVKEDDLLDGLGGMEDVLLADIGSMALEEAGVGSQTVHQLHPCQTTDCLALGEDVQQAGFAGPARACGVWWRR